MNTPGIMKNNHYGQVDNNPSIIPEFIHNDKNEDPFSTFIANNRATDSIDLIGDEMDRTLSNSQNSEVIQKGSHSKRIYNMTPQVASPSPPIAPTMVPPPSQHQYRQPTLPPPSPPSPFALGPPGPPS